MPDAAGKAIFFSSLLVVVLWHKLGPYWHQRTQKKALHVWLAGNNLLDFERDLHDNGVFSVAIGIRSMQHDNILPLQ